MTDSVFGNEEHENAILEIAFQAKSSNLHSNASKKRCKWKQGICSSLGRKDID